MYFLIPTNLWSDGVSQSPDFNQATPWPMSMTELAPAERFIVWCFRRWVLGLRENNGSHWSLVWNEFARQLGAQDGKAALSNFTNLVKCLQVYSRRKIYHHQPCCPCLSGDEAWVISLVAACQNRQLCLARSLAEWMIEPEGTGDLLDAGLRLAEAIQRHALNLQHRPVELAPGLKTARPGTVRITMH